MLTPYSKFGHDVVGYVIDGVCVCTECSEGNEGNDSPIFSTDEFDTVISCDICKSNLHVSVLDK